MRDGIPPPLRSPAISCWCSAARTRTRPSGRARCRSPIWDRAMLRSGHRSITSRFRKSTILTRIARSPSRMRAGFSRSIPRQKSYRPDRIPTTGKSAPSGHLPSKAVQMMDYANPVPLYEQQGDLIQTGSFYKAIALPDGKVLVTSGKDGTRPLQNYEERNVLPVQLFDPSTGTVTKLAKTTVSRGLHGNALLLPDATVMIMGDDRINLVPPGDRAYPPGDPDQGVANCQI